MRVFVNIILFAAAFGCKTSAEEGREPSSTPAPLTLTDVADDAPPPPSFEKLGADDIGLITGFDADGELSCLPLPTGRECLKRKLGLVDECQKAGGELVVCEDCSLLCSRPLASTEP